MKKIISLIIVLILYQYLLAQVTEEWVAIYDGPEHGSDKGTAIAVDESSNVYVTGIGFETIKYNSAGAEQWVSAHPGNAGAIAVDHDGNVYATGFLDNDTNEIDYGTIKFDSEGNELWFSTYSFITGYYAQDDYATAIAVDGSGNVYVTGASETSAWYDYATIKYNSGGDTLWVRRFGGWSNDKATAIVVDNDGYVYVTGYTDGGVGGGRFNYGTIKYSPSGDTVWTRYYNGLGNDDDIPYAIAVDKIGNVYITGQSWGNWYDDYATLKYDSSGELKWVARYNGPVNSYDKARSLALDDAGNVYVTGESGGTGINYDYTSIKYDSLGVEQWVSRYNAPDNQNDYATSLALDGSGNVYVTGYSESGPAARTDYATLKYDNDGYELWVKRYEGSGNFDDEAWDIAVDGSGDVYVTGGIGFYDNYPNYFDCVTIKYVSVTAIDGPDTENARFFIYPNPAGDAIKISAHMNIEDICIFNVLGEKVLSVTIHANQILKGTGEAIYEIDLSGLPSGIYFVSLYNGEKRSVEKLFIE